MLSLHPLCVNRPQKNGCFTLASGVTLTVFCFYVFLSAKQKGKTSGSSFWHTWFCHNKNQFRPYIFSTKMQNFWKTQRNPMLLFVFVGVLFKFKLNRPAFVVLFQLPPRMKATATRLFPRSIFLLYH